MNLAAEFSGVKNYAEIATLQNKPENKNPEQAHKLLARTTQLMVREITDLHAEVAYLRKELAKYKK